MSDPPTCIEEPNNGPRRYPIKSDCTVHNTGEHRFAQKRGTDYDPHRASERYFRRTRNTPTTGRVALRTPRSWARS